MYSKSCAEIKRLHPSAKSGVYTIQPKPASKEYNVYCNMLDYGGGWTLVTLIASDKSDQWMPQALYPEDLSKFTTSPSRVSKLSDADINALLGKGGTRWVTAGDTRTFYRMTSASWFSDHGRPSSCTYKRDFYDAMAVPAPKPVWKTTAKYIACGGINDGKTWGALSGRHAIHSNQPGAYDPSKNAWKHAGYVFVRSVCPSGWIRDITGTCKGLWH